ncbi:MAG: hypothetical protein ACE1ZG_02910 [Gammaproteobacteria bacterium]
MKELKFTDYFRERLILRNIPKEHQEEILRYLITSFMTGAPID